jgi:hypothetical protein
MVYTEKIISLVDTTTCYVSNVMSTAVSNVITAISPKNVGGVPVRSYYNSRMFHRSSNKSDRCDTSTMSTTAYILSYSLVTLASSVLLVQYTTSANPIGRCVLFFKQLRRQVSGGTPSRTIYSVCVLYCMYCRCGWSYCVCVIQFTR